MTDIDAVREYYESFDEHEWHRLDSGEGRLEFAVTCALLDPVLPASGRVLDLGGGPGRYTQWLATRGMQVTLADLSPTMLDTARAKLPSGTANEIIETDARNLSRWNADHFDVTLALGPFYHLTAAADREQALSEIIRVTATRRRNRRCPDAPVWLSAQNTRDCRRAPSDGRYRIYLGRIARWNLSQRHCGSIH